MAKGRMAKIGKVLNTDVGKLARGVKRGMAKRKVRKIRQDKMAYKYAKKARKKAGYSQSLGKGGINDSPKTRKLVERMSAARSEKNPIKRHFKVRKAGKQNLRELRRADNMQGVTRGMNKGASRTIVRSNARKLRRAKIAEKKAKESAKISKQARRGRVKVEYQTARYRGKLAQGTKRPSRGGSLPAGTKKAIAKKKARVSANRPQANPSQIAAAKRNRNIAQGKKAYKKGMSTLDYAKSLQKPREDED